MTPYTAYANVCRKSVIQLNDNPFSFIKQRGLKYRQIISPSGEKKLQLVVPARYREAALKLGYSTGLGGQMGRPKTLARVQAHFYWPGIGQEVARFVKSCDVCQKTIDSGRVKPAPLQPLPIIDSPFERVAVDLVGPIEPRASDGSRYILTLVDFATRWAEAVLLKNIETQTVAEALMTIFCRVGIPRQILSDRGTQFTSGKYSVCLRAKGNVPRPTIPWGMDCVNVLTAHLRKCLKAWLPNNPRNGLGTWLLCCSRTGKRHRAPPGSPRLS